MTEKQKAILKAMEAVDKGSSISAAARQYGIPRTTLHDKIRGFSSVLCSKGPPTILSKDEEDHLKSWIIFMANSGFPITKAQLLDSVSILVKKLKRDNPFRDDRPGRHWFEAFIKRHPEVGQRVAQNLTQTRARVQESHVRLWFKEVHDYFILANLEEAAQDPRRIFNCDESAFFLSPSDNRVLAKRGSKNIYNVIPSGEKECVTVLLTANAAGELAPPMVLFKLKSIPHKISKTAPNDWGLGITPKGWMTGESFFEYMTNVFYPWIEKSGIQLPIIFFLDGHCSHTTLPLSNFCREKNIQLVALYPNATHLLQPMDVAVFRPLKRIWKKEVYDWRNHNQFGKLRKEHFCPLLHKSLQQLDPNTIKNGFRKSGLSPFDANNVDYSKCVTSQSKKTAKPDNNNQMQPNDGSHKYFESQISPKILKAFYASKTLTWRGDKTLEGLFNVWRQMQAQNDVSLNRFKNDSDGSLIQVSAEETSNIMNDSTLFGGIGNFTGLTDILDCNFLNTAEFSEIEIENQSNKENVGTIEVYENLDGTLTKIMDMEMPVSKTSLTKLEKDERTQETSSPLGQVIRTIGSKPIYITSQGMAPFPVAETINVECNISEDINMTAPPQTYNIMKLPEDDKITPPSASIMKFPRDDSSRSTYLTFLGKASPTNGEPTFERKSFQDINMKTPPQLPIVKLPEENNSDKANPKYYGDLMVPTPFKDALFWPETPSSSTKSKFKLPSVITSDRWQIFAQKKQDAKKKKEEKKFKVKDKKIKKSVLEDGKKKFKKNLKDTRANKANEDWFCRLCHRNSKLDMIQCVICKTWYHTICAEVSPNDITYNCMYCNVLTENNNCSEDFCV